MKPTQRLAKFRALTRNIRTSTTVALWSFAVVAIGLLVASFVMPPSGTIDPTAIRGASLIFAWAALFEAREAILEGLGVKVTHGDTTIVIHDLDGKDTDDGHTTILEEYHQANDNGTATETE